jgi:hypothetical protein
VKPLVQVRELPVHRRGQSRLDPGVKLAGLDIGDQFANDLLSVAIQSLLDRD